jgi:hypothetical protein
MARIKKTRFRHSALISAVTMAAPALAATAILSAQSAPSPERQPGAGGGDPDHHGPGRPTAAALFAALAPATAGGEPLVLGAQTHFSQNWPGTANDLASQARRRCCAISLPWAAGETVKGRYNLDTPAASNLANACAAGRRLILTQIPTNPLYDGGLWVTSEEGRLPLPPISTRCATSSAPAWPPSNWATRSTARAPWPLPPGSTASAYVRIAATAHARFGRQPGAAGWIDQHDRHRVPAPAVCGGLLDQVDGLAVHPYRNRGEALDLEMARLNAAMDEAGKRVPVWATEFGLATTDQTTAAGELVKQATMLGQWRRQASWYALIDQAGFPTMGLFTGTALKDQGRAFRFVQDSVLGKGRATGIDMGDPLLFAYRFGSDTTVIWGAPRGLVLGNGTRAYGPTGLALRSPVIGDEPIVLVGKAFTPGTSGVVADTLLGWGTGWRYFVRDKAERDTALDWLDDSWTGYFGNRYSRPLRINTSAAPAGTAAAPCARCGAIPRRWPRCWTGAPASPSRRRRRGRPHRQQNGKVVWQGLLTSTLTVAPVKLVVAKGDTIDMIAGPNQTAGGDAFFYRATLSQRAGARPLPAPTDRPLLIRAGGGAGATGAAPALCVR